MCVAAWMAVVFFVEYRRAGGMPWAGEVPLALIALMTIMGAAMIVASLYSRFV